MILQVLERDAFIDGHQCYLSLVEAGLILDTGGSEWDRY